MASGAFAATLACARKDLLRRLRDPLALLAWIGVPLLIGGLLSLMSGGDNGSPRPRGTLLVADLDDSFLSGALASAFGQGPMGEMFTVEAVEPDEGRARMERGKASAMIVVPEGFGDALLADEPCRLELVKNPSQTILPGIVEEALSMLADAVFYLQRIAADPLREDLERFAAGPPAGVDVFPNEVIAEFSVAINDTVERLGKYLIPPVIELTVVAPDEGPADGVGAADAAAEGELGESGNDGEPPGGFGALFFPCILFMSLLFMAQGISDDVWLERAQGTLRRAVASPFSVGPLLAGKLAAAAALLAPIALGALALGVIAFGFRWRDVPLALVWVVAAGATATAFMTLIQLYTPSQRAGSLITMTVLFPMLMLGGAFFPFEAMPGWMADIGRLTPNGWALERLKDVLFARWEPVEMALGLAGTAAVFCALYLVARARLGGRFASGASGANGTGGA